MALLDIWSLAEPGLGLTAVSLATLRPLLQRFGIRLRMGESGQQERVLPRIDSGPRDGNLHGNEAGIEMNSNSTNNNSIQTTISESGCTFDGQKFCPFSKKEARVFSESAQETPHGSGMNA